MRKQPFFSIVIPTYNRSHYLDLAIQSILQQDYLDYEIIISDNASTDNTKDIIKHYQKQGCPIIYHHFKQAVPPQHNGIKCFFLANGKFIFMLADDDAILKKETLGNLHKLAIRYKPGFIKIGVIFYYEKLETIRDIYKGLLLSSGNYHVLPKHPTLPMEIYNKFLEFTSGSIYKNDEKLLSYLNHDDVLYFSIALTYELSYRYGAIFCGDEYIIGRYFATGHYFYNFIEPKFSLDTILDNAKQYFKLQKDYRAFDQKLRRIGLVHMLNWRLILSQPLFNRYIYKIYLKDNYRLSNFVYYGFALLLKLVPCFILRFFKRIYMFITRKSILQIIEERKIAIEIQSFIKLHKK